jgi:hypothetical protein
MPETGEYLILGLAAIALLLALFIGSMVVRYRNLTKDIDLIQRLQEEES